MVDDRVTKSKLEHYVNLTKMAREKATRIPLEGTPESTQLDILLRMADDYARAFGAINYAHAWIDAGVKLRLLDGHGDDNLFTLP